MSLAKRKSRSISVDGEQYRWTPSLDSGYYVLAVQSIEGHGKKLEIIVSTDQNVIIENGYSVEFGSFGQAVITPRLVAHLIRQAKTLGWDPTDQGPPAELTLHDNQLHIRRGL